MYIYKTEILTVSTKQFSDKADEKDVAVLDQFITEKVADGWEFVTDNYMGTAMQIKGAFIITFRKHQ